MDHVRQDHAGKYRTACVLFVPLELGLDHSTTHDVSMPHCTIEELIWGYGYGLLEIFTSVPIN